MAAFMKNFLRQQSWLSSLMIGLTVQAGEFKFPNQTLTVPDGFVVERIAGPPLVDRPIAGAFDEQGRLYVTDSAGMSDKAEKQLEAKPHRVVRLEDTDGDGRFDKSVVFADRLMFPEGCLWYEGSLYVAAPPIIWKLTDTDGDGVADKRVEWFDGKTVTSCANDLHGPYLGRDGWFYWTKGAYAEQHYTLPNGKPFVTHASHIFRARPDCTGIEPVLTGGMANPVNVAFSAAGERFLSCTFFVRPAAGQRDGLLHAIYGGVYGQERDAVYEHKMTGSLMPELLHSGASAPCGLTVYDSHIFGDDFEGNLLACHFNLRKVSRHVLETKGATFRTRDSDFLVSDNPDFHPTDVIEDADGSLLVVDTGGWYKICCPTSQLWKPDVLGAIYRVRKQGARRLDDPRGLKLQWSKLKPAELARLLGDERVFVQRRAIHELGRKGAVAVTVLNDAVWNGRTVQTRRNAVWALARLDSAAAREAVRTAINDEDVNVAHAALSVVSLWRDKAAVGRLQSLVAGADPQLARPAAEALGRLGKPSAVPALLEATARPCDRVFEHSLIYALIEIGDRQATEAGLRSANPQTRRAALIALDEMDGGKLPSTAVIPLLNSADPLLKQTAIWIAARHPEWSHEMADHYSRRLAVKLSDAEQEELAEQIARMASDAAMQEFIARSLTDDGAPAPARRLLLRAMNQAALKQMPAVWEQGLRHCLAVADEGTLRAAVAAIRTLPADKKQPIDFTAPLMRLALDGSQPDDLRVEALAAVPGGLKQVEPAVLEFLKNCLDPARVPLLRSAAAAVVGRARWSEAQLSTVTEILKNAGSMELMSLLPAFDKARSEAVGLKLVAALKEAKNLPSLRADTITATLKNYPPSVRQQGEALVQIVNVEAGAQQAHLRELVAGLPGGDVRRGQALFQSEKAACAACHTIGYLGGKVGPDLTRIGQVRTEQDLLESIVYPSRTFVRSYEPVMIITKDGEPHTGFIRNESAEAVQLVSGLNAEERILRNSIAELRPGTLSVMPAGLEQQLQQQELADLVAFLKSLK